MNTDDLSKWSGGQVNLDGDSCAAKSCPFCGSIELAFDIEKWAGNRRGYVDVVACGDCGAVGPFGNDGELIALELWNKRHENKLGDGKNA